MTEILSGRRQEARRESDPSVLIFSRLTKGVSSLGMESSKILRWQTNPIAEANAM